MIEEKQLKDLERSFWIDKGIIILLLILLCIQGVSALDIYSGDTINITFDKPYTYYSVVGNLTEINLNITQEGDIVWITFDKYTQDDSFEMVFFDAQEVIKTIVVPSNGGGSTRTIVKEVIKEVPNYITQYVENETIEYQNKTNIEYKIVKESIVDIWIIVGGCILFIILFSYFTWRLSKKYSLENIELEGGLEENE